MPLKAFNSNIIYFSKERLLRCNYKTLSLSKELETIINHKSKHERIKDYFDILSGFAFKSEDYVLEGVSLVRIGDLNEEFNIEDMAKLPEEFLDQYSQYVLEQDDILVSLTGDGVIKTALVNQNGLLLNQRVGALRAKREVNIRFIHYLLSTSIVKKQFLWLSNGKAQLNISPLDFLSIKIPIIDVNKQERALIETSPIEQKIKSLKSKILPSQKVIDEVFAREFGFDYAEFERLHGIKSYMIGIDSFSNNPDLRFSAKFHREAGEYVMHELCCITNKKIKNYLVEPICLGASISPKDYDDNGEYYYLSMATIKNWGFDKENATLTSNEYSNEKTNKYVKNGDIILARSGEGTIGKVALIQDEDIKAIFADFTMRIRLNNYNHRFAYYYMRTTYFQYLVEIFKKGLGNNTNIFPIVIQEFPIPDISSKEQDRIVKEIQEEINKQNAIKSEISSLREQINEIIESVLMSKK